MNTKLRIAVICLSAIPVLLSTACGGEKVAGVPEDPGPGNTPPVVDDTPAPQRSLQNLGATSLSLSAGERTELAARLSNALGPVAGARLRMDILDESSGARFESMQAELRNRSVTALIDTDAAGEARVALVAPEREGRFDIEIFDRCETCDMNEQAAPALRISVEVAANPHGVLVVNLEYVGTRLLGGFRTELHDADFDCATLSADTGDALQSTEQSSRMSDPHVYGGLDPAAGFNVVALGLDRAGRTVALACDSAPALTAGQTSSMTLSLGDIPLQIDGDYTLRGLYDMKDAVPGETGERMRAILAPFDDPDDPARYLLDRIAAQLGFDLDGNMLARGARTALAGAINRAIDNNLADALGVDREVFALLSDGLSHLADFAAAVPVESRLSVGAPNAEGEVTVRETWERVAITWREHTRWFPVDAEHGFPEPVVADYVATRDGDDQKASLTMPAYTLDGARLGPLFNLYVRGVLLPVVTGTHETDAPVDSFGGMLRTFISCDAIADEVDALDCSFEGDPACDDDRYVIFPGLLEFSQSSIANACGSVLDSIGEEMHDELQALVDDAGDQLRMCADGQGEGCRAELLDEDNDLVVEQITAGALYGELVASSSGEAGPVAACFAGLRSEHMIDAAGNEAELPRCSLP